MKKSIFFAFVLLMAVRAQANIPCDAPISVSVSNITSTSVKVSWEAVSSQTKWWLEYRRAEESFRTPISHITEKSYTLENLDPSTEYVIYVGPYCGPEDGLVINDENWLSTSFVTHEETPQEGCATPTGLTASEVKSNSAILQWEAPAAQAKWQVKVYKNSQSGVPRMFTVEEKSLAMEDLESETKYLVQVRAVCGEDDYSEYTSVVRFTTPAEGTPDPDPDPETEGVDALNAQKIATKVIRNGQLMIRVGDKIFDAQGKEVK